MGRIWPAGRCTTDSLGRLSVRFRRRTKQIDPLRVDAPQVAAARGDAVAVEELQDLDRDLPPILELVAELRGVPSNAVEAVEPRRKGMAVTRSFGTPICDFERMMGALSQYALRAGEKLRSHGLVAARLTAFFHTNKHRPDRPQYCNHPIEYLDYRLFRCGLSSSDSAF